MATPTRIYVVSHGGGGERLIRASHPSHALMHAARSTFDVHVASQDELVALLERGVTVETIKAEQQELPT